MTNYKPTKKALLSSVVALLICFTMLTGTTFAWFTDSVTSANNIIKSGNLDVELYYQVEGQDDWTLVTKDTNVFKKDALWEPGHTEVVKLKVVNAGSLDLKYNLGINVADEVESINVLDEELILSEHIKYGIVDGEQDYTRDTAIAAVSATATALKTAYNSRTVKLEAKNDTDSDEKIVTMVVYMPTTVGNEANAKVGEKVPTINLGINLFATQVTSESDSFDEYYDGGAVWLGGIDISWYTQNPDATTFKIGSAEQLAGLAAIVNGTAQSPVSTFATDSTSFIHDDFKGDTILLISDIDLDGEAWTPIGRTGVSSTDFTYAFKGTFDGQNNTIANLSVKNAGWAGVFGIAHKATIKNLTVSGVEIASHRMAGAVVGQLYGSIDNCHVNDAEIKVVPNSVGDSYDNGDKVGGIVGWLGDNDNNHYLTNCTADDVNITAYRDLGGIAGYVARSTNISGNKVTNSKLTGDQSVNNYGDKDFNVNEVCGRCSETVDAIEGDNKHENVTITIKTRADKWDGTTDTTWYNDTDTEFVINTAEQFAGFSALVDGGNTFEGKEITLDCDLDLSNTKCFEPIGSYRKDTAFKGTFDGQGHAIVNMSQNTWALDNGYYYGDLGLGLFGLVEDATIKNLVMDGAEISGESAICGTIAATAYGKCTFENITVKNSNVADYQYYAGGIVGWASGEHQYINCNVDASTTVAAQWGDFDNSIGGVIGGAGESAKILLKDCTVACRIDAYNDVTSTYQWYAYRRCGMLIGNTGKTETVDGTTYAAAPQLTCENVTVTYGDWANYTYCEFAGTSWPYVRVQAGVSNSAYSNPRYGHPTDANGNEVVDDNHVHNDGEDHFINCTFDQLYGGGQGVYGEATHDGVTVVYNNK